MAVVSYNNNNTWTAPTTDYITIELWGGGGGGGSSNNTSRAGTGGGGGAYVRKKYLAKKDEEFTFVVGAGGANGGIGGWGVGGKHTYIRSNANDYIASASGGAGGQPGNFASNSAGGNNISTGGIPATFGDIWYAGGNGVRGNSSNGVGGGGGAGGGNASAGNAGTIPNGGVGANGGGNGATGGANDANATDNATSPGGGGGGSGKKVTVARYGSPGKEGAVKITYNEAVTISGKVTNGGANVAGAKVIVSSGEDNNANNSIVSALATSNATGNWSASVPANKVYGAYAQYDDGAGNLYTAKAQPFVEE